MVSKTSRYRRPGLSWATGLLCFSMTVTANTAIHSPPTPYSTTLILVLAILIVTSIMVMLYSGTITFWPFCLTRPRTFNTMDSHRPTRQSMILRFQISLGLVFLAASLVAMGSAHLWLKNKQQEQGEYVEAITSAHLHTLSQSLSEAFSAASTLSIIVQQVRGQPDNFEDIAHNLLSNNPGLNALQLSPEGALSSTISKTEKQESDWHNLFKASNQNQDRQSAMNSGKLTVSGPLPLPHGGAGAIARQPIFLTRPNGEAYFWGFAAALIRFPDIINAAGLKQMTQDGLHYVLCRPMDGNNERKIISASTSTPLHKPVTFPVVVPGIEWMLSVAPIDGWISNEHYSIAFLLVVLFVGIVTTAAATILKQPLRLREEVKARTNELAQREARFRNFFEKNRSVMMLVDPETGVIQHVNEAASVFYGYSSEELVGHPASRINAMNEETLRRERQKAMRKEKNCFQFQHRLKDGSTRNVEVYSTPFETEVGTQLFSIIHDVTERKQLENETALAASVFTHASEAIVVMNNQRCVISVNSAFEAITGISQVSAANKGLLQQMNIKDLNEEAIWSSVAETGNWSGNLWGYTLEGEQYAALLTINQVFINDNDETPYFIALFSDITELKQQQKELEDIAHYDPLTGLPNRLLYVDRLNIELARTSRYNTRVAVLFLDLDGFKQVNDLYGHNVGDRMLNSIAQRLKESVRENDTVARIGGDEFVLILTGLNHNDDCVPILNRLLLASAQPIPIDHEEVSISASIGVAFYPDHASDPEQLMRLADHAMYEAKQSGRNRYAYFTEAEGPSQPFINQQIQELDDAINNEHLRVYYQPKINLRNGDVSGFEALIRWNHPEKGILPPGDFLAAVEGHSMSIKMDNWVLKTVCRHLADWNRAGFHTNISVNVSAKQLQNPAFPKYVREQLLAYPDIEPTQLEFEILESSALQDLSSVSETMQEFKTIGINFSLDDFGTGYSTLNRLQQLPVHALKIDKGFVIEMLHQPANLVLVKGVLGLSEGFGLHTIAEGIESIEHGVMLIRLGCEFGQGYCISHPLPHDDVVPWFESWVYPTQWHTAYVDKNGQEEIIIEAEVEHQSWMRSFTSHVERPGTPPPEMDAARCKFGVWCKKKGHTKYAEYPLFPELVAEHQRLHDISASLLTQAVEDRDMRELETVSNNLLLLLRRLPVKR